MHRSRRRLLISVGSGLVVLSLGFGVLNAFYWLGGRIQPGPGLYDYWSSSLGDAILLPLLVSTLTWLNLSGVGAQRDNVFASIAFVVGLAVGVLLQASWLADPSPVTNWTLPSAHTFTTAGWYHAGFLALIIAVFMAGVTRVVGRLARLERQPGDEFAVTVVIITSIAFVILLVVDNATRRGSAAGAATLVASAAGVLALGLIVTVIALRLRSSAEKLRSAEESKSTER